MNNFDLHQQAQELADTKTAYELARALIETLDEIQTLLEKMKELDASGE